MKPNAWAIIAGLGLILGSLPGCNWLGSPPPPTPTPLVLVFVTATPTGPGSTSEATGTPTPFPLTTITPRPLPPTLTPSATATLTPRPTSTPVVVTATSTGTPQAVIDSPGGSLLVRGGPGLIYEPPLGAYNNGAVVEVIGKQHGTDGRLWWLIPFSGGPAGRGWIYADYTIARNVDNVPWVTAPPLPPPPSSPSPTPPVYVTPSATINSPAGFSHVRSGPGLNYDPPLGTYNNGAVVQIIGKQFSTDRRLWWLIPFGASPNGQGWIYADHTIARNVDNVPWVAAPPTPTPWPGPTWTPTPTRTPPGPTAVTWTITGRVVEAGSSQPIEGALITAQLGSATNTYLTARSDANGQFFITGNARNEGDLILSVAAPNYEPKTVTGGSVTPRIYSFPALELVRRPDPVVSWTVSGRVSEPGSGRPIPNARVEAILGVDALRIETTTNANGNFSLGGQARDAGFLSLNISAAGYQSTALTLNQTTPRVYNLPDLQLIPLAGTCRYESVINLSQASALTRLQSLGFTNIQINLVSVEGNPNLVDRVLSQEPIPPAQNQVDLVSCAMSITLNVGAPVDPQ